jgi:hypothetical protein
MVNTIDVIKATMAIVFANCLPNRIMNNVP